MATDYWLYNAVFSGTLSIYDFNFFAQRLQWWLNKKTTLHNRKIIIIRPHRSVRRRDRHTTSVDCRSVFPRVISKNVSKLWPVVHLISILIRSGPSNTVRVPSIFQRRRESKYIEFKLGRYTCTATKFFFITFNVNVV